MSLLDFLCPLKQLRYEIVMPHRIMPLKAALNACYIMQSIADLSTFTTKAMCQRYFYRKMMSKFIFSKSGAQHTSYQHTQTHQQVVFNTASPYTTNDWNRCAVGARPCPYHLAPPHSFCVVNKYRSTIMRTWRWRDA